MTTAFPLRAAVLAALLALSAVTGCHRAARVPAPSAAPAEEGAPAAPLARAEAPPAERAPSPVGPEAGGAAPEVPAGEPPAEPPAGEELGPAPADGAERADSGEVSGRLDETPPVARTPAPVRDGGLPAGEGIAKEAAGPVLVARLSDAETFPKEGPLWTRSREELVYKVEFLGITMGYARFTFNGKVLLAGREAFHVNVRAWTSSVLSLIFPMNDTIDYYLDVRTLAPLRQEYARRERKKEDVTVYDQERGTILYADRRTGEVRRRVDAVPGIYDPVTVAYFYRTRDLAAGEAARKIYAGRKVYEVVPKALGTERIRTAAGEVETLVVRPVLFREGKVDDKGDMRMWVTRDERRVPVRFYAKFRKIRTWTLVGELLPGQERG